MKYVMTLLAVSVMFTSCAHTSKGGCGCSEEKAKVEGAHECACHKSKDSKKTETKECEECKKSEKASK